MANKILIRLALVFICLFIIFSTITFFINSPWKKKHTASLNVFTWADYIPQELADNFEKETGIHVTFHYYASNEELLVKMRSTKGRGYDLLIPSDYAVKILIDENLLEPINKKKIHHYCEIAPFLLGQYFDPKNDYSIPGLWEIVGFGIDREAFLEYPEMLENPSLKHLFEPIGPPYKITMTPDATEAIALASQYLYNKTDPLSKIELLEIEELLTKQKEWTEAYADYRAKYLISTKNCPISLLRSSFFFQTKRDFPFIEFLIPKGPAFLSIENYAIPKAAKQNEAAYRFINFLSRKENTLKLIDLCPLYPSVLSIAQNEISYPGFARLLDEIAIRGQFSYFRYLTSENEMRKLWINVKKN
jgi:spermidine/putrescine transport system substrate-binding protein